MPNSVRTIQCESKKRTREHSLVRNIAKWLPIFKILSLVDSAGNFATVTLKIPPRLSHVATLPCEISLFPTSQCSGSKCSDMPCKTVTHKTVSKYLSGEISSIWFPDRKMFTSAILTWVMRFLVWLMWTSSCQGTKSHTTVLQQRKRCRTKMPSTGWRHFTPCN